MANLRYTFVVKGRYWRFRKGQLKAALPGVPGDAAFHARYAELLALADAKPDTPSESTVAGLVAAYRASAEFRTLRGPTQLDYARTLDLIVAEMGDQPYRLVTAPMVKAVRDDHAATPRKAHKIKQMVSRLYTWAQEEQRVRKGHNPAADFKRLKARPTAITPWSDAEIALFLAHAPKHLRTAVLLLFHTGQRCEDAVKMEWTAYQGDFIRVVTSKTAEPLDIPCHRDLLAALDPVRIRRGRILRNAAGKPYTANALRKAIDDACRAIDAMPAGRSPHGLRYAAAGAMEEAGCTVGQIILVLGHRTYQMGIKYIMGRREAAAGLARREGRA